jgi:4-diphosphocytidyl-2C-methyl-D-erythritol kinase
LQDSDSIAAFESAPQASHGCSVTLDKRIFEVSGLAGG